MRCRCFDLNKNVDIIVNEQWGVDMLNKTLAVGLVLFLSIAVTSIFVHAQDENGQGGVKSHGVVHNIAEDREVINVGGAYEPEGLDKYMKRKFDDVTAKVATLESKVDELSSDIKKLNSNIESMVGRQARAGLVS